MSPQAIGPYALEEELARGAMGVLYRGRAPDGQERALKVFLAAVPREQERRRMEREVDALRRLNHPGLARLHEVIWERGRPCLVLDLVRGETLEARLRRQGPLPAEEVRQLGLALSEALAHAHAQGVLHRDLKPANVILNQDGDPVLVDFGLAKELDTSRSRLTATGVFLGTPGFWAPEQALGQQDRVGPASDVYGLGAVLYAALTGEPPQAGETLPESLAAAELGQIEPPSRRGVELDPRLERVVLTALARDPGDRYPDARRLGDALLAAAPAPPRAGPAPVAIAAAVLVVGAGAAGALVLLSGGARPGPGAAPTGPTPASSASPASPSSGDAPPSGEAPSVDDVAAGEALIETTLALLQAGRLEEALAGAEEALARQGERPLLLVARASARRELGDLGGADADLDRAVAMERVAGAARSARATARFVSDRLDLALQDAEAVLASGEGASPPARANAHVIRGRILARRGQAREALADVDAALALKPGEAALRVDRAALLARLEDYAGARVEADRALESPGLSPARRGATLVTRALCWMDAEELERARQDLTAALKELPLHDPQHALALRLLDGLRPPGQAAAPDRPAGALPGEETYTRQREAELPLPVQQALGRWRARPDDASLDALLQAMDAASYPRLPEAALEPLARAVRERGLRRMEAEQHVAALQDLGAAQLLRPEWYFLHELRAQCLLNLGDMRGVETEWTRMLELLPEYPVARSRRMFVRMLLRDEAGVTADAQMLSRAEYSRQAGLSLLQEIERGVLARGSKLELLPYARRLLELPVTVPAPEDRRAASAALEEARGASAAGQSQAALAAVERALRHDPGSGEAHRVRADLRERLGDMAGAEEDLSQALSLQPELVEALALRCKLRYERKNFVGARVDAENLVALAEAGRCPPIPEVIGRMVRSEIRVRWLDPAGALRDAERALTLAPGEPDLLLDRGSARMALNDHQGALADAEQALAVHGKTYRRQLAWALSGFAKASLERLEEAEADLLRALREANPDDPIRAQVEAMLRVVRQAR